MTVRSAVPQSTTDNGPLHLDWTRVTDQTIHIRGDHDAVRNRRSRDSHPRILERT